MSTIESMRKKVQEADEKNRLINKLLDFTQGEVISKGHKDFEYYFKNPFIRIGSVHTMSEHESSEVIKAIRNMTNELTSGIVGGYSSAFDSADWATITVPLASTDKQHIKTMVRKIKKYCPRLVVKFTRTTEEEYK